METWLRVREIRERLETKCLQESPGPSQHKERGSRLLGYQRLSCWTSQEVTCALHFGVGFILAFLLENLRVCIIRISLAC